MEQFEFISGRPHLSHVLPKTEHTKSNDAKDILSHVHFLCVKTDALLSCGAVRCCSVFGAWRRSRKQPSTTISIAYIMHTRPDEHPLVMNILCVCVGGMTCFMFVFFLASFMSCTSICAMTRLNTVNMHCAFYERKREKCKLTVGQQNPFIST